MDFTSPDGERRWAALVRVAADTVVGLDFDGTLSPIVDDPARAHIHPDAPGVLAALARQVSLVAVVTGRPARQALDLGLDDAAEQVAAAGDDLAVFGQYGNERWSTAEPRVRGGRPPRGLASFERELPRLLRRLGRDGAFVEDKGLAVAVHTRRLPDADAAFAELLPELEQLASGHDLVVEPGRNVIEVRAAGVHKGGVVEHLAEQREARGFVFAGDDLGDVEAFEAVAALRDRGLATLLVCSASSEEGALAERADVVVRGPAGVLDLLRRLTSDAADARA